MTILIRKARTSIVPMLVLIALLIAATISAMLPARAAVPVFSVGQKVVMKACGSVGSVGVVTAFVIPDGSRVTSPRDPRLTPLADWRLRYLVALDGVPGFLTVNAGCIALAIVKAPPRVELAVDGRLYVCEPQTAN